MPRGFQIQLHAWTLSATQRAHLREWVDRFFADSAWLSSGKVLVGWLGDEPHTVAGLRALITNNLRNWKCPKLTRYQRQWVKPLTAVEFNVLVGRPPQPVRKLAAQIARQAAENALKRVMAIQASRQRAAEKQTENNKNLLGAAFKATRTNAPRLEASREDGLRQRIACLRAHLDDLALRRTALPGVCLYLPFDWEKISPEEAHAQRERRGYKRKLFSGSVFNRKDEERHEAGILHGLVAQLVDG